MNRPSKRPVFRLSAMCVAIAMAFNPMSVAHADVATWTGSVDTSWANGANWSGGVSPSFMDVIIDGASTVASSVFMDMSDTVKSLVIDAGDGLTNNGYTLTLGGSVTNQGLLTISGGALLLAADVTLAGTGQTVLNGGYIDSTGAAYTLTIDAGHTLKGNGYLSGYTGYNTSLVNKGTIIADNTAGSPLYFYGPSLDNTSGLIKVADGANFYVGSGTVSGGTVQGLGANSTIGGSGSFSNLLLKGGFNVSGSSFNNVVFEDTNVISSSANISGTITNKGSITINSGLLLASDVTLTGNGQTVLNGGYIDSTGAAYTLTIDTGHTLKGHGNLSGVTGYYASLVNKGTIIADNTAGNPLYFYGPNLDNSAGLIKVADGATFYVNSGTVSGGTVQGLGANSTIGGSGSFSNLLLKGGFNISGSSFNNVVFEDTNVISSSANISGTITNKGSITINSGLLLASDVTLTGTGQTVLNGGYIDSTGAAYTLTIDAGHTLKGYGYLSGQTGYNTSLINKGTIIADNTAGSPLYFYGPGLDNTSGLIKVADGATFYVNSGTVSGGTVQSLGTNSTIGGGGSFSNMLIKGGINISGSSFNNVVFEDANVITSTATVSGTITNKGSITLNGTALLLGSDVTLTGTGQTVLNGGYIDSTGSSAYTLTIDTGHTLKGYGYLGGGYYGYYATNVTNKGTIFADNTAGSPLYFYGSSLDNTSGLIKVADGATFSVGNSTVSGGTVQGLGSGGATISGGTYKDLTLTGKLQASSATISGTINNKGSITINNSFLLLASDATLTGTGQTVLNGGYIDSTGSAHTLTIDTGHTLKGYGYVGGGYYGYNASLINKGTIIANTAGSSLTFYGPDFKNLGVVKVDVNSRLQVASANLVQDDAAAKTIVDGVLTAPQIELKAGTLSGNGEVVGAVLNTGGDVGPGASPGKLTITGDYTQTTGGRLTIDISGDEQGLSYDWLAISGYAALGGDLYLNVGYAPADGTSFTFLTSVLGVSGAFDHIYANGWKVATSYGANDVRVTLTAAAVPEPGSILMLLAGLGVVALARPRLAKQA